MFQLFSIYTHISENLGGQKLFDGSVHTYTHTHIHIFSLFVPISTLPVTLESKKIYVCEVLAWLNQMQ